MAAFHCAVVIPTKNAMPRFVRVLEMVRRQKTPWPYEIIVIDSGSRDGTVEFIQSLPDIRLIQIEPKSFGHGKTRNQAIAASDADFVALITHDAEPLDENWLANIVAAVEQDDNIAGAFGRHIAYEDASPFTKNDLDQHFAGFLAHPLIVNRFLDEEKYQNDQGWRQFLHFYSDNNSCMRKSVWKEIPYPDVEFAEDQLWAREIINRGYSKAYVPDSVVIHSHDFTPLEQLRRAFDEARNFQLYFGYELSGTINSLFRSIFGFTFRYLYIDVDNKYGKIELRQRIYKIVKLWCLSIGHYIGSKNKKIPNIIQDKISLDRSLYNM